MLVVGVYKREAVDRRRLNTNPSRGGFVRPQGVQVLGAALPLSDDHAIEHSRTVSQQPQSCSNHRQPVCPRDGLPAPDPDLASVFAVDNSIAAMLDLVGPVRSLLCSVAPPTFGR